MCPGFFWSFSQISGYLPVKIDSANHSLILASNPQKFNRKHICRRLIIRLVLGRKHMCSLLKLKTINLTPPPHPPKGVFS
jgi:hypothetical protein